MKRTRELQTLRERKNERSSGKLESLQQSLQRASSFTPSSFSFASVFFFSSLHRHRLRVFSVSER
jgi:hypothetical protein